MAIIIPIDNWGQSEACNRRPDVTSSWYPPLEKPMLQ